MPYSQIDAFHAKLQSNPDLFRQLFDGVDSADAFIERVISEARMQGYHFDKREVVAWIENITVPEIFELSDEQLEVVAGGKDQKNKGQATQTLLDLMNAKSKDFENDLANIWNLIKNSNYEPPPWQ